MVLRVRGVYRWCMTRTNVVLDEKLVRAGQQLTGARTVRDLVDRALRELVEREEQRKLAARLRGSGWTGDVGRMRRT